MFFKVDFYKFFYKKVDFNKFVYFIKCSKTGHFIKRYHMIVFQTIHLFEYKKYILKGDKMSEQVITKNMADEIKKMINVPFSELQVSKNMLFLFFQIGVEPYYFKIVKDI